MEFQHYFMAIAGGLMTGSAAGWVLLADGRVGGVSGMVSSVVRPRSVDAAWQALFLVGLVAGGMLLAWLDPAALPVGQIVPLHLAVGAGLLVGFGAARFTRSSALVEANSGVWDNRSAAGKTD